jgi:hypothetical protein
MSGNASNTVRGKWPFKVSDTTSPGPVAPIEAGTVDLDHQATCVGCGCTDGCGCASGCSWLGVNRANGTGVCSNCTEHFEAWKARQS